ncbi:hypothetical protein ACOME3_003723 [Neoechinorhynchus agilis]
MVSVKSLQITAAGLLAIFFVVHVILLYGDLHLVQQDRAICMEKSSGLEWCKKQPLRLMMIDGRSERKWLTRLGRSLSSSLFSSCQKYMSCFRIFDLILLGQLMLGTLIMALGVQSLIYRL